MECLDGPDTPLSSVLCIRFTQLFFETAIFPLLQMRKLWCVKVKPPAHGQAAGKHRVQNPYQICVSSKPRPTAPRRAVMA